MILESGKNGASAVRPLRRTRALMVLIAVARKVFQASCFTRSALRRPFYDGTPAWGTAQSVNHQDQGLDVVTSTPIVALYAFIDTPVT